MRLSVVLGLTACFLLPFQGQAAWDIFQSYVILDSGSGDQFFAGGLNADGATAFAGTDLGDFTAADALTLNGGELKTYKNGSSNVCGGTLNYRVYASGDTPGAFTALALPYDSELANPGDQKWAATGAGIDLLGALTAGDYVLELYWEATGDDAGGCSDTKYDSDFGNNFTATFSIVNAWPCGNPVNFDCYNYSTVLIGDQCWFAENLRTTVYADGSDIQNVTDNSTWRFKTSGARCDYDNDAANVSTYGRLYNWFAANDARGLCPTGWHVPTDAEWMELEMELGMSESEANSNGGRGTDEGTALKSTTGWPTINGTDGNGTDDFGFSALPGGYRDAHPGYGEFNQLGSTGFWWSSTPSPSGSNVWWRRLNANPQIIRGVDGTKSFGRSVRCIVDAQTASVPGCTDPAYAEYDALANTDDGSCATAAVSGCTDPAYTEYSALHNVEDCSCSTWVVSGCTDPAYTEYYALANTDDGSCSTLVVSGCTTPNYTEYDASANTDDGSCATLSEPFICGDTWSYNDHSYSTVQIGEQCWFAENLRTTTYADGTHIGVGGAEWNTTTDGAMAVYGQDESPCSDYEGSCDDAISLERYGRLYNWYAVDDARGLCPTGWSVPSDDDWKTLEMFIGMSQADADGTGQRGTNEGFKLKTDGQYPTVGFSLSSGWSNGSDEFGFAAMPGGRTQNLTFENTGQFVSAGWAGFFWTSTASGDAAWRRELSSSYSSIGRRDDNYLEQTGMSVRCFKSSPIVGCTDPDYLEYDATATGDDGSCATLAVNGCTDPSYSEYDAAANNDDGSCASQIPCYGALDVSISMDMPATTRFTLDGSATLVVNAGTPTSLTLTGQNGSPDYTFPQPGAIDGLAAGFYNVTATDASGCTSNETQLLIMYSQCCDCGENDQDADGICDDTDNCSDRLATNFDDPANEACIGGTVEGCMDPAAVNYNPNANRQREEPQISIAFNLISDLSSFPPYPSNPASRRAALFPGWHGYSSSLAENWEASEFPNAGTVVKTVSKPEDHNYWPWGGLYTLRLSTSGALFGSNYLVDHFDNAAVTISGDVVAANGDTTFYLTDAEYTKTGTYRFRIAVCHYAGCTDENYTEYDPDANLDDGSCSTSVVLGCTNPDAVNYDPSANTDDGSCCSSPTMDGYTYDVVLIGEQCWYAENVRTKVYRNGNSISWAYDGPGNFGSLGSAEQQAYYNGGLWSYANEADGDTTSAYSNEHGLLYNWYAVNNSKICPVGWKTPTNTDWSALAGFIQNQVGKKLKATSGWPDGGNGTDIYGWGGVPHYENYIIGRYWSQTALSGPSYKSFRSLFHDSNAFPASGWYPTELLWARCLQE